MEDLLSYEGYTLVFEDHFDAAELNRNCWNVELHEPGWVNEEWQEYVDTQEVIRLENSKLLLRPIKTVQKDGGFLTPPDGSRRSTSVISLMACLKPV